ncbi:MAG: type II secretion system secretin GspD [Deltaproteobacteria bacterium]|nr:type II secretion system secretin GspD [Deltaproteobacteria bacterium]MCL5276870.1 type II secretion system secretin GspD [Deltaproteobacteria bacterium]
MNKKVLLYTLGIIALLVPVASNAGEAGNTLTTVTVHKPAKGQEARAKQRVTMDFNEVDIKDFIKVISKITGKDFILSQNMNGKVTIISPTPVTIAEAWKIFESVLQVNQLTTVGNGDVIKIIPLREARGTNISTYMGNLPEQTSDVYITQVVPLRYVKSSDMANVLRPFLSAFGNIQPYDATNTLIITESASNIDRLLKIVHELDTDTNRQTIKVIQLKYATAQSVASIITNLYAGQTTRPTFGFFRPPNQPGQAPQAIKVLSDDRTNSIILVAGMDDMASIEALIQKLDVPVVGEGQIHVYYLKNANAEKLASTLATLAGSGGAVPGQPGQRGPAVAQLAGGVKISADPATNSLIIIATPQDYEIIKGVIRDLDIRRRQVYVQAVIAELSLSATKTLGVDLNALPNLSASGVQVGGISNMGAGIANILSSQNQLGTLVGQSGMSLGIINGTISYNGVSYINVAALLNALETNSQANVLATPDILATDNEPAQIMVGENVPIPTGQSIGQISGYTQTYVQRQDVGLTLKITPQINAGDYVRLKLNFELTAIIPSPQGLNANAIGVTTSKRSAETVVTVKDRSTIVIGGLLQDNASVSESKIPFLGDLPIIGWLFRYSNKTKDKTNLMIFLTPYIIKDQSDIAAINSMKEVESKKFEKETYGYELKNSPFTKTFDNINEEMKTNAKQPQPLLFTGETYITPEGEFPIRTPAPETATTITQTPVPVTGSTVPETPPGVPPTWTSGPVPLAVPSGAQQLTGTTGAQDLTGTAFTAEATKPSDTTVNKP